MDGNTAWLVVLTLGQLVQILSNLIRMRRNPPVAEELYRDFATRAEVAQLRQEFLNTSAEIFSVMRSLKESSVTLVGQVNRLDGILSRCPGPSACAKEPR